MTRTLKTLLNQHPIVIDDETAEQLEVANELLAEAYAVLTTTMSPAVAVTLASRMLYSMLMDDTVSH